MDPAVIESHRDALKAFDTAKGTIRFTPGAPLPEDLIRSIVKARIAETDARPAG
jgi:uncharacterized protein YdhG (YjbR/CyaY superfamily)